MNFSHRSLLVAFFFCGAFLQAGKWEDPLHLGYGTSHKVVMDKKGNSIAVWKAGSDRKSFIQIGLLSVGTAEWKILHIAPKIESDIFYTSPSVVLNKNGDAIITWKAQNTGQIAIMGAILPFNSETLSDSFFLSFPLHELVRYETVIDGQMNAAALWEEINLKGIHKIGAAYFLATDDVMQIDLGEGTFPKLSVNEKGQVFGLWIGSTKMKATCFSNMVKMDVVPFKGVSPSLIVGEKGNAFAFWKRDMGPNCQIEGALMEAGAKKWHHILDLPRASSKFLHEPVRIERDSEGNLTLLWSDVENGKDVLRGTTLKVGLREVTKFFIKQPEPVEVHQTAISPSGYKMALWTKEQEEIVSSRYNPLLRP